MTDALQLSSTPSTPDGTHAWALTVRGDVDVHTCDALEDAIDALIDKGATLVVLDLDHVDFVDSSGIRVVLRASRRLRRQDGQLLVRGMSAAVERVLEITGLLESLRERAAHDGLG